MLSFSQFNKLFKEAREEIYSYEGLPTEDRVMAWTPIPGGITFVTPFDAFIEKNFNICNNDPRSVGYAESLTGIIKEVTIEGHPCMSVERGELVRILIEHGFVTRVTARCRPE